mmetsp:Transcript_16473/g.42766  ORF Transcript_16473/g.42766 Transcript_16473/m.42766 type:complete len:637 (-) Transcript_16473:585-2495(-)
MHHRGAGRGGILRHDLTEQLHPLRLSHRGPWGIPSHQDSVVLLERVLELWDERPDRPQNVRRQPDALVGLARGVILGMRLGGHQVGQHVGPTNASTARLDAVHSGQLLNLHCRQPAPSRLQCQRELGDRQCGAAAVGVKLVHGVLDRRHHAVKRKGSVDSVVDCHFPVPEFDFLAPPDFGRYVLARSLAHNLDFDLAEEEVNPRELDLAVFVAVNLLAVGIYGLQHVFTFSHRQAVRDVLQFETKVPQVEPAALVGVDALAELSSVVVARFKHVTAVSHAVELAQLCRQLEVGAPLDGDVGLKLPPRFTSHHEVGETFIGHSFTNGVPPHDLDNLNLVGGGDAKIESLEARLERVILEGASEPFVRHAKRSVDALHQRGERFDPGGSVKHDLLADALLLLLLLQRCALLGSPVLRLLREWVGLTVELNVFLAGVDFVLQCNLVEQLVEGGAIHPPRPLLVQHPQQLFKERQQLGLVSVPPDRCNELVDGDPPRVHTPLAVLFGALLSFALLPFHPLLVGPRARRLGLGLFISLLFASLDAASTLGDLSAGLLGLPISESAVRLLPMHPLGIALREHTHHFPFVHRSGHSHRFVALAQLPSQSLGGRFAYGDLALRLEEPFWGGHVVWDHFGHRLIQ